MTLKSIRILALSFILCLPSALSQKLPPDARASRMVIDVASPSRMRVDGHVVPNGDLLTYLNQHQAAYRSDATANIVVSSDLTLTQLGMMTAAVNKAGYHKTHIYFYTLNETALGEIVFPPPVPIGDVRGSLPR